MNRRLAPGFLLVLLAGAALIAPPTSAHPSADPSGEKLLFAMSIADERGAVLAEPKLLGQEGVPLEMTLADPGSAQGPYMSLRLDPEVRVDGRYDICFEISLPGRVEKGKGRVTVRPGEERTARVSYPGGHVDVQLAAFSIPSAELELYLDHGIRRHLRPGST